MRLPKSHFIRAGVISGILLPAAILTAFAAHNRVNIREDDGWIATAIYPDVDGGSRVRSLARDLADDITKRDPHDFIVWAKEDVKSHGSPDSQYAYRSTPTVTENRSGLVSILWTNEWDIGGEHPTELYDACSVGIVHGAPKVLGLSDLFRHGVDVRSVAAKAIIARLQQDPDAVDVQNGRLTADTPGLVGQFYLGDSAVTFILSSDIAGRYAVDGAHLVKVPYASLAGIDPSGPLAPVLKH